MQALSTLGQAERLKVLEHLYELLCLYEAWDGEVSTVSAELDHYKNEKIAIRKKHKNTFLIFMWFFDPVIIISAIFAVVKFMEEQNLVSALPALSVTLFFVALWILAYLFWKRSDKKSCSDVLLSEYLAELYLYCKQQKKIAANNMSYYMSSYAIPGVLSSTKSVEYVYDMLMQYPQMKLVKAIEYYNASERERQNREDRARLAQQLEAIKNQSAVQHKERMDIARDMETSNRSIANMLDDIRYATGSHY